VGGIDKVCQKYSKPPKAKQGGREKPWRMRKIIAEPKTKLSY
jgi:hypothetical protein